MPHLTYLSWHGLVELEPPRRPEPDRPAAPPAARAEEWKFGLTGTRCRNCGFVHLPPVRVCRGCGTTDQMDAAPVAALHATIVHAHRRLPRLLAVPTDDASGPRRRRRRPVHASKSPTPNPSDCAWARGWRSPSAACSLPVACTTTSGSPICWTPDRRTMASHGIADKVAVVGMGCTRFGERWDSSTEDLILEASRSASTRHRGSPRATSTPTGWEPWGPVNRG